MSKDAVEHYKKKLLRHVDDSDKVLYCLKKLDAAHVTIEILQDTEVGKVVNKLKKNPEATKEVIEASKALVSKWKEFVQNEEEDGQTALVSEKEAVKSKSKAPSEDNKKSSSSKHHHKDHKKDKKEKHKSHKHSKTSSSHKSSHHDKKKEDNSNGTTNNDSSRSSSNGYSHFDLAIPADINPNYKPKPRYPDPPTRRYTNHSNGNNHSHKVDNEEDDALTAMIAYSKSNRNRTAVYSGKKTSVFYSPDEPFPTLKDMCILILQENVDRIDECGNLDYKVMKPVLERAKPDDLMRIEEYNPKLMDDTGELWEKIVKRRFPKGRREEMETFREQYERSIQEEKEKLDKLMGRVQNSYNSLKTNQKQTKVAYVDSVAKPPRGVKRAQEKHGTFIPVGSSLDKIKKARISKAGAAGISGGNPRENATKKPKVAPLMAKTFKMARGLKSGFRR